MPAASEVTNCSTGPDAARRAARQESWANSPTSPELPADAISSAAMYSTSSAVHAPSRLGPVTVSTTVASSNSRTYDRSVSMSGSLAIKPTVQPSKGRAQPGSSPGEHPRSPRAPQLDPPDQSGKAAATEGAAGRAEAGSRMFASVRAAAKGPDYRQMQSDAIMRVCCVDGPCQGLMYLDVDTGRVLFGDVPTPPGAATGSAPTKRSTPWPGATQPPASTASTGPSA
jgi:hypothetical protein